MGFIYGATRPELRVQPSDVKVPTKIYVHEKDVHIYAQICDEKPNKNSTANSVEAALTFTIDKLCDKETWQRDPQEVAYVIATPWVHKKQPVVDVYAFSDLKDWPSNPTVEHWLLTDSVRNDEIEGISCGLNNILLGKEEELRCQFSDLEHYALSRVNFEMIGFHARKRKQRKQRLVYPEKESLDAYFNHWTNAHPF